MRQAARAALRHAAIALALTLTAACGEAPPTPREGAAPGATAAPDTAAPQLPAMAVTIDDLPWVGALRPGESRSDALARLIDAVTSRGVPAIAFANCGRAGTGAPQFRQWIDAGLELGNHSAAHLDLNRAPVDQWLRDVQTCHDFIHELTGETTIWFRYPFLHQGPTPERQAAALALLQELASPVAHVTIDTSDWILAVAYGDAVRAGAQERAAAIGDAFVEHVLRATRHYQQVARDRVGRDVAHVLLLHANLLVADHIGILLDRLADEDGFRFVTVQAAHRDPVYDLPDDYTGSDGLSWLYRFTPAAPELAMWDDEEARRLRQQWR